MSNTDRWNPEEGERYYIVDALGNIQWYLWGDLTDNFYYKVGNCFRTREEAQEVAETWKRLLNEYHANKNLNWRSSSELMELFTDALKNTGGLSANSETTKLPDWCKVGKWVFDSNNGYGEIISIKEDRSSCFIEFDGGAGDFVPEDFTKLKQARLCPYNAEEMKALVGKVLTRKSLSTPFSFLVLYAEGDGSSIESCHFKYTAKELKDYFTIDGKPCGKLVHKEGDDWVE